MFTTLLKRKALPCCPRKFWKGTLSVGVRRKWCVDHETYTADDLIMVGEMGLAVLAAVDALGVEVDVVGEAHLEG